MTGGATAGTNGFVATLRLYWPRSVGALVPDESFVSRPERFFLDRIAAHILAFEGGSHVEWFKGNFADYEEDTKRRLGDAAV